MIIVLEKSYYVPALILRLVYGFIDPVERFKESVILL